MAKETKKLPKVQKEDLNKEDKLRSGRNKPAKIRQIDKFKGDTVKQKIRK